MITLVQMNVLSYLMCIMHSFSIITHSLYLHRMSIASFEQHSSFLICSHSILLSRIHFLIHQKRATIFSYNGTSYHFFHTNLSKLSFNFFNAFFSIRETYEREIFNCAAISRWVISSPPINPYRI